MAVSLITRSQYIRGGCSTPEEPMPVITDYVWAWKYDEDCDLVPTELENLTPGQAWRYNGARELVPTELPILNDPYWYYNTDGELAPTDLISQFKASLENGNTTIQITPSAPSETPDEEENTSTQIYFDAVVVDALSSVSVATIPSGSLTFAAIITNEYPAALQYSIDGGNTYRALALGINFDAENLSLTNNTTGTYPEIKVKFPTGSLGQVTAKRDTPITITTDP